MFCAVRSALRSHSSTSLFRQLKPFHPTLRVNYFCSSSKGQHEDPIEPAPLDFYDDNLESDKIFFETLEAMSNGNLSETAFIKNTNSWRDLESQAPQDLEFDIKDFETQSGKLGRSTKSRRRRTSPKDSNSIGGMVASIGLTEASQNLGRHLQMQDDYFTNLDGNAPLASSVQANSTQAGPLPTAMLNYALNWHKTSDFPRPKLAKFIPDTDPNKFRYDEKGRRACGGHKQRRGLNGVLGCHVIDLTLVDHVDTVELRRFVSEDSQILPRRLSRLCSKCQRVVAKTIKRARNTSILPHLGDFAIRDKKPELVHVAKDPFHTPVAAASLVYSKSIK